ncbi:MAG: amidohydrolase [Desulfohalobiaceae bacterium]|nr:amidohydrolase [Desulfohalobiaceae bacterium]
MDRISARIQDLTRELVALRRDFHAHPELGFQEYRTAECIERYLQDLGLTTKRMARTGVVALLQESRPGPVLMLRADIDALPITEENSLDYCSQNKGVMHACGHDAHTAMLLVAARILVEEKNDLAGSIKFVFQPNEEIAGARPMIEEGVLEDPQVDAVLGLHVWTPLESGKAAVSPGPVMGGLDVFRVIVRGQGGHTGSPHQAVDPVMAAASLIQSVQIIQTREIDQFQPTIIMFGKLSGGTRSNIIPDQVELEGSIRFLYPGGPDSQEQPTERFKRIARSVCETHRCGCDIEITHENIPLVNDPAMAELARKTAQEIFGSEKDITTLQTFASEDFSEFSSRVPGAFIFLGAGNAAKGTTVAHHNPRFDIDEEVLPSGVALLVRGAFNFCSQFKSLNIL